MFSGSPGGSPLVVPPGPLAAVAFESGMSAVEELRLFKVQVQDVARVCNAVVRGNLSQKITVPVQSMVMVQLKYVNTMITHFLHLCYEIHTNLLKVDKHVVAPCNIAYLQELVRNDPTVYPGARHVVRNTGERIDLRYNKRTHTFLSYG